MAFKTINIDERRIRSTVVPIDGDEFRVEYYSWTVAELRKVQETVKEKLEGSEAWYLSNALVDRIHALPDVVDKKGKPVKITLENLDKLDITLLQAINKAIEDDQRPKAQPGS